MLQGDNREAHSLPPFANDENKALSEKIKEYELKIGSLTTTIDSNTSRTAAISQHLRNVKQEIAHIQVFIPCNSQALHDAKNRQIETEDHFKQIAEREAGRLTNEIKRLDKEVSDIADHVFYSINVVVECCPKQYLQRK